MLFKYQGIAWAVEYMKRDTDNPINYNPDDVTDVRHAYKGWGVNQQLSYLLDDGYEVATRYTYINPHHDIAAYEDKTEVIELGLTKYFKGHRLKFQVNGSYAYKDGYFNNANQGSSWGDTFQVELGI